MSILASRECLIVLRKKLQENDYQRCTNSSRGRVGRMTDRGFRSLGFNHRFRLIVLAHKPVLYQGGEGWREAHAQYH